MKRQLLDVAGDEDAMFSSAKRRGLIEASRSRSSLPHPRQFSSAKRRGLIEALSSPQHVSHTPGSPRLNAEASLKHAGILTRHSQSWSSPRLNAEASLKHVMPAVEGVRQGEFSSAKRRGLIEAWWLGLSGERRASSPRLNAEASLKHTTAATTSSHTVSPKQ